MSAPNSIVDFRIIGKLDEGGMGAVHRATNNRLNRDVAVKVLPPARRKRRAYGPLRWEAEVLASLNPTSHPFTASNRVRIAATLVCTSDGCGSKDDGEKAP